MPRGNAPAERVVVLGGGVIGVSTAAHLRRRGVPAALVTEGELASGASGRSLSWLNSAGSRSAPYHALRIAGIDRYRTLFAADPTREWLRFDGGLCWKSSSEETQGRHQAELAHGYESHVLSPHDAALRVPGVAADAVTEAAVHNPGEGWVSLPHLIEELAAEFVAAGGELVTGAGRSSVRTAGGRAVGVRTEDGRDVEGDAVVVACGAQTPEVVAELGGTVPGASPPAMLVVTEPTGSEMSAVLNTPRVAVRPNPGGTFALDHDWYTDRITVSATGEYTIDEAVVKELVAEASTVLAGDVPLAAASWKLGPKPIPGDGEPVFGRLPETPGCYVAFTHSGATLGLIAGELIAHELGTGTDHPMLVPFRPERFQR
ncbi:NAD(P)/FAD-dependent oxidoreductase [Prauserella rugosa]|uniref:Glycine/D-amino acid oxidase-like deaminating enzyme n=1 Tax=Prauserella rugosa TaxID=43354 RepID=A0A660CE65_9PSEU|nr:FAD-binding oxidoreductase [Prauserella rugosa]KID28353.1 glycine/D-amino acid oxidase, deaminating [Prauserella sp. Am3]TWH19789.1 glycine/D-amino acid oxidase-like deaminating enzyme [Prauserella rugosa]